MKSIFISAGHGGNDPGRVVGEWSEHRACTWLRDQVTLGLLRKGCIVKGDGWGNINQPGIRGVGAGLKDMEGGNAHAARMPHGRGDDF